MLAPFLPLSETALRRVRRGVMRKRGSTGQMMRVILSMLVCFLIASPAFLAAQEIEKNFNSGRWDENIVAINALLSEANELQSHLKIAELTVLKARQFLAKASHQNFPVDSAYALLTAAKSLSERYNFQKVRSDVMQLMGQLLYRDAFENRNFLQPRAYFRDALTLRKRTNDPQRISQSLFWLGLTYEQMDKPDSAAIFYREAYSLASRYQLKIELADAARHLGSVAETTNQLADARKYYEESLLKRREAQYSIGVPYALITVADFIKKENPTRADSLYHEAALVAEQNNVWRAQVNAVNALGELLQNECEKAIPLFTKARQLSERFGYKAGERRADAGLLKCTKEKK